MWQRVGGGGGLFKMENITLPSTAGSVDTSITVDFEPDFVLAYIPCSSTNIVFEVYIKDEISCQFQFYGSTYYASKTTGATVSGNVITITPMSSQQANASAILIYGKV